MHLPLSSCYYNYAKIILVQFIPFYPCNCSLSNQYITSRASSYFYLTALDVNVKFFSKNHIPFVIVSVFVFLTLLLPPILLLVLYPTHCFISMLFECYQRMNYINIFIKKFHSCYRDGLDGGRDLRSFVTLYFLLAIISFVLWT